MKRLRLRPLDLIRTAGLGVTGRPQRTALASLGVALGIASLVALTGAAASNQAALLAELDAMGADLAVVRPGLDANREPVPLPAEAPERIARLDGVDQVGVFETPPPDLAVFRSDVVPSTETGGLTVAVARPDVFDAAGAELAAGRWFDESARALPVAVLGPTAAARLGIAEPGGRVYIGGQWHGVLGILADSGLASSTLDTAAILGDQWVRDAFGSEPLVSASSTDGDGIGEISEILVRAEPGRIDDVRPLLAASANLTAPQFVAVGSLADLAAARETTDDALATLGLALGGIALLVGGVGIANTMVVAVMERRGEIGLRRALGARPGQIASQFTAEAVALSAIGGGAGLALGVGAAVAIALVADQPVAIPVYAVLAGPALAVVVGAVAGLGPAIRAARVSPTQALRAS